MMAGPTVVAEECFESELTDLVAGIEPAELFSIPGIYDILAEFFNDAVMERIEQKRQEF